MEQKRPTNAQLQKRIKNAVIFIPRTKDTQEIFFNDKGVRLVADADGCVIETNYHRNVFSNITSSGVSRPWLYTKRIIEIANENDCATESGYSYQKLLDVLKAKDDKSEYNIAVYYEWWLMVIFDGLFSISEFESGYWLVYFKFLNTSAINHILLEEHTEDMTNKDFVKRFNTLMSEYTEEIDERVLFPKKTDEERVKEEIESIQEQENEQAMEAQINGGN